MAHPIGSVIEIRGFWLRADSALLCDHGLCGRQAVLSPGCRSPGRGSDMAIWAFQNPNRFWQGTSDSIRTKIETKMSGQFTYPKMGCQNGFDNHCHMAGSSILFFGDPVLGGFKGKSKGKPPSFAVPQKKLHPSPPGPFLQGTNRRLKIRFGC